MRRQVDYHLAQARAAGSAGRLAPTAWSWFQPRTFAHAASDLCRPRLAIEVDVSPEHSIRCQREDVDEMLGICWISMQMAGSAVRVQSSRKMAVSSFSLMNDGRVLSRRCAISPSTGVRADEARLAPVLVCRSCVILPKCTVAPSLSRTLPGAACARDFSCLLPKVHAWMCGIPRRRQRSDSSFRGIPTGNERFPSALTQPRKTLALDSQSTYQTAPTIGRPALLLRVSR